MRGSAPARPPLELWLCAVVVIAIPGSLATPWGTAGTYLPVAVSALAALGLVRLRPSAAELNLVVPYMWVALVGVSTIVAGIRDARSFEFIRGTVFQNAAFLLVLCLAAAWRQRGGKLETWVSRLLVASAVVAVLAMFEYATKTYIQIDAFYSALTGLPLDDSAFRRAPGSLRAIATAGNPLPLGTLAAAAATAALGLYLTSSKAYLLLIYMANAGAALATLNRSSWTALAAGSAVVLTLYLIHQRPASGRKQLHYVVLSAGACLLLAALSGRRALEVFLDEASATVADRVVGTTETFSYTHRVSNLEKAAEAMAASPLALITGFGLGAENAFFLTERGVLPRRLASVDPGLIRTFDNTFLTVAYSFGLAGALWLVHRIASGFYYSLRGGPAERLWYVGMLATVLISMFFYNYFGWPLANYLLACLLGMGGPAGERRREVFGRPRGPAASPERLPATWHSPTGFAGREGRGR